MNKALGRRFVLGACLLAIGVAYGCASVPLPPRELQETALRFAPPPGMSNIYLYRAFVQGASNLVGVSLDSKVVGALACKTYIFGPIEPGQHEIRAGLATTGGSNPFWAYFAFHDPLTVSIEAGQSYFFEVDRDFIGRVLVRQVGESEGKDKIKSLSQSGFTDLALTKDEQQRHNELTEKARNTKAGGTKAWIVPKRFTRKEALLTEGMSLTEATGAFGIPALVIHGNTVKDGGMMLQANIVGAFRIPAFVIDDNTVKDGAMMWQTDIGVVFEFPGSSMEEHLTGVYYYEFEPGGKLRAAQ